MIISESTKTLSNGSELTSLMTISLRPTDKKMRLTKIELQHLIVYLERAKTEAFQRIHNYKFQKDREEFYQYFLQTISEKILNKLANLAKKNGESKVTILVNFGEEKTLRTIFQRINCNEYVYQLQVKIRACLAAQ